MNKIECPNCHSNDFILHATCDVLIDLNEAGGIEGLHDPDMSRQEILDMIEDGSMEAFCTSCGRTYPVDFDMNNKVVITGKCFEEE